MARGLNEVPSRALGALASWIAATGVSGEMSIPGADNLRQRQTSVQHRLHAKPAQPASHTAGLPKEPPNHLLVIEPSFSIHGTGGNVGRYDAYGITFASVTRYGNRARKAWCMPPSSPV